MLPLATIDYSEQSGALAALRAASAFDGPLRALGPKLVVGHDPRGQMAQKLIREMSGVGPAADVQMASALIAHLGLLAVDERAEGE